jgi:tetratricopeptide (TPR) repeat protein
LVAWAIPGGGAARLYGTTPLPEVLQWLDERVAQFGPDWRLAGYRSAVLALLGRFDEARPLQSEFRQAHEERGDILNLGAHLSQSTVALELLAGDPSAAAEAGEQGCRILEEAGERSWLSTGACWYAEALYQLGRLDEAEEWARKGLELADSEDMATQVLARQALAKVLARREQHAEAESMMLDAVARVDTTDALLTRGDSRRCLAEVLELGGRREEAAAALAEALELYERKGAVVHARHTRERLGALEPA